MDDDHMTRWLWETNITTEWEHWAGDVERLIGHDLDGSQREDGYSLDTAYDMYEAALTPLSASVRIKADKDALHRLRWEG